MPVKRIYLTSSAPEKYSLSDLKIIDTYAFDRAMLPACRVRSSSECSASEAALRAGLLRSIPGKNASQDTPAVTASLQGYRPPSCDAVEKAATPDEALRSFEANFPAALKDEEMVEKAVLDQAQVASVSAYLACLAARTDFGPDVAETSLWFFSSKRYGARALAALDREARDGSANSDNAREFAAQIRDYMEP